MSVSEKDRAGLIDAALEIAAWQASLDERIREALEDGDEVLALSLVRELYGLEDKAEALVS